MTVSSSTRKAGPFLGNASATVFPFGFKIFTKADLKVLLVNPSGLSTPLTLDSDYSVTLNPDQNSNPGGWITYPISGTPLPAAYSLVMLGDLAYDQETDITNGGGFYPNVIEDMSDRSTIQIQQLAEVTSRALVITEAESTSPVLPNAQARANSVVGFDALGNVVVMPLPASLGAGDLKNESWTDGTDYTAGTSNSVTLSRAYATKANLGDVVMQGISQDPNSYSLNGLQLVFDAAIPVGVSRIWCVGGTTLSVFLPPAGSVGDGQLQWLNILGRSVDTIAALRALDKTRYNRAVVMGYYALGDGPGGRFWCDLSDTTTAEDGISVFEAADGGRWKLQQVGWIDVRQAGATGDGATDDTAALARVKAFVAAQSTPWLVVFSEGTYCYTVSPNWAQTGARVVARGRVVLRYKGVGNAVILDGGAVAPSRVEDFIFGTPDNPIIIEAPTTAANGVFARALLGGVIAAIVRGAGATSAGLLTNFCILTAVYVRTEPYIAGWYDDGNGPAKPQFGMILNARNAGEQTSYCTFINPVANACQYGFYLDSTLGNVFVGGDAEYNTANGMLLTVNALNNKIHGTDFEKNGTGGAGADVSCAGQFNEFVCDTQSNSSAGGFRFVTGSVGNRLHGGTHDQIAVDAGTGNYIGGCVYGRGISGNLQIVDNGTKTSYGRNWQAQQQKWTYGPSVVNAVAVGASPFTYTNTTGMPQVVHVTGGTVSAAVVFRGATQLGAMSGSTVLSVNDSLSLTYSVAPTVVAATLE